MDDEVRGPDRVGAVRLDDGRALGWAQWGPEDGTPVLFCSGAGMGRGLGFGAGALDRLRARVIAVDRPGLGASDPDPERTLATWPADVRSLAEALGLRRYGAIGFSQGAPFALACAAAGGPAAVAVVSGQDDLAAPALAGLLAPDVAAMLRAAAKDPAGFEASFTAVTADVLWGMVTGMSSDADRAVYTAPHFASAYRASLDEGFAQGGAGYARDLALTFRTWPFAPEEISVPVHLWYGGLDTSPVHSPDHGATLAGRVPGARRHLRPDAGGALPWTHSAEILAALLPSLRD